jgi:hypothetical protein
VAEILLGTSVSGSAGAGAREAPAQASLAALSASGRAVCVNLTFQDAASSASPLEELPALRLDGPGVSGVAGPRKPVVSEMLDVLAAEAARRGMRRVGLVNADIVATSDALEYAATTSRPALAVARTDTGSGAPDALLRYGIDMFTFDVTFWRRERRRFRAYLLGEPVWDNVYAAIVCCHGGEIVNRQGLLLHARHPLAFIGSPFARYVHLLAARDSSYFSLWCAYVARMEAASGMTADEDVKLQQQIFRAPGLAAEAVDVARAAWWRARQVFGA